MATFIHRTVPRSVRRYCTGVDKGWIKDKAELWEEQQKHVKPEDGLKLPKQAEEIQAEIKKQRKEDKTKLEGLLHTQKVKVDTPDPWASAKAEKEEAATTKAASTQGEKKTLGKKREISVTEGQVISEEAYADTLGEFQVSDNQTGAADAVEAGISQINHPEVDEENYPKLVEEEPLPLILSCWAPHVDDSIAVNVSLRLLIDAVNAAAAEPKIKLVTLDCNHNYSLSCHLNVNSLPTMLAIHEGSVLEQQAGLLDEEGLAQFVFGYSQFLYGEESLSHLGEELPICKLIDARVALKAQDYVTSFTKYSQVYSECMPKFVAEKHERAVLAEKGEYVTEASRALTDNEVMAAKSLAGLCLTLYHEKKYRPARKTIHALQRDLPKASRVLADVKKTVSTVDIMMLTGYQGEDVEDLEDEERIDQHNLDIKLKLAGGYFGHGEYHKALSTVFILIRKNRDYKDGIAVLVMTRIMTFLGKHHPIRDEYNALFFNLLQVPNGRWGLPANQKLRIACSEPGPGILPEEIPLMIDPSPFYNESLARHPLLR